MLMPTSPEFVSLCRSQISLLTQGLGASLSVVYLTQELIEGGETQLVPIVAYPDIEIVSPPQGSAKLLQENTANSSSRLLLNPSQPSSQSDADSNLAEARRATTNSSSSIPNSSSKRQALVTQRQIVLPLMHEEVVMGLLVTERNDRAWNEWEQTQIHEIAETLALACVMDQRYQWLHHNQQQQRLLQEQQHDILDNLLHQFRNSLTALQTFSKLILKRLVPGDGNRDLANSIMREAMRLRELSDQLEQAATGDGDIDQVPISLPPAWVDHSDSPHPQTTTPSALLPATGALAGAPLILKPIAIAGVLEPLLASATTIARERHLFLEAHLPPDLPMIQADAQSLREVLNNLLENALKYTPPGGRVLVEANLCALTKSADRGIEIAVSDDGPGIPQQDLPHIFERRFRGVQAEGAVPGSGLGLAIAQALITQMQGKIQVFSPSRISNLDKSGNNKSILQHPGTTFTVWLPLADTA